MKTAGSNLPPAKLDMTPMIDVVFQLMIFFMLTLKIVTSEGNFDINMPLGAAPTVDDPRQQPDIKVRLVATPEGTLGSLKLGQRTLGTNERAFAQLNSEILKIIGRPGNPLTKDVEVEIDADYNLNYAYVIQAISSCTGTMRNGNLIRYVEKIKFASPRKPV
jgi:biopolymer transport protein ExbD